MKTLILVFSLFLVSCGPSKEELDSYYKNRKEADSIKLVGEQIEIDYNRISKKEIKKPKYYLANQFNLITGTIIHWAPSNDEIFTWKYNGGSKPNRKIYVHIQDNDGMVRVMECNYFTWLNLHTGDILK